MIQMNSYFYQYEMCNKCDKARDPCQYSYNLAAIDAKFDLTIYVIFM